jgi:glycine dehydrogenase subunit 1
LLPLIEAQTMLVVAAYPDFFGRVYDLSKLAEATHAAGALFCVSVNPIALGLLTPPGEFGADIVTGEGQPLGIPPRRPYLGILPPRNLCARWPAAWLAKPWITAASAPTS